MAGLVWLGLFYALSVLSISFVLQSPGVCEGLEAAVVGFFYIVRKTTAGQLLNSQMITYTLAAYPFFVTGVCAVAIL